MEKDLNFELERDDVEAKKKRTRLGRMRNLAQYKEMSDEQFDEVLNKKVLGIEVSDEFEKRIIEKIDEFAKDYDLTDLKINDRYSLRALIQTLISLEDNEQTLFRIRKEGVSSNDMFNLEKLHKIMSDLRADISKLQNDLNITRKIRKSDQDISVMAYIDGLKEKARKFYESKMSYVYCPKCNMLLGTFWTLYPENEKNKIVLVCERKMTDGTKCGEKVMVSTKDLIKNRGTNKKSITPESML